MANQNGRRPAPTPSKPIFDFKNRLQAGGVLLAG
jgi:hypothetical protein